MIKWFKFKLNILVRDKLPENMENNGLKVRKKTLATDEFQEELLKKLIEESQELALGKNKDETIAELGDVFEIIDMIMQTYGISHKQVLAAQEQKRLSLGGFNNKQFIINVEVPEDSPSLAYYLAHADKYMQM